MKKYIFVIIMNLTLVVILAGLGLAAYYPINVLNTASSVQRAVGSTEMALPLPATAGETEVRVEYPSDQAIQVRLPEAYLQKQLDLVLEASPFGSQDRTYEGDSAPMCAHNGMVQKQITPAPTEAGPIWKQTLEALGSTVYDPYVIFLRHPSVTRTDYKLVVDEDAQPERDPSVACPTSTEENQVEG